MTARIFLGPMSFGLRIDGPAEVHLDFAKEMSGCNFQNCTLMYRGKPVASLREWLLESGQYVEVVA